MGSPPRRRFSRCLALITGMYEQHLLARCDAAERIPAAGSKISLTSHAKTLSISPSHRNLQSSSARVDVQRVNSVCEHLSNADMPPGVLGALYSLRTLPPITISKLVPSSAPVVQVTSSWLHTRDPETLTTRCGRSRQDPCADAPFARRLRSAGRVDGVHIVACGGPWTHRPHTLAHVGPTAPAVLPCWAKGRSARARCVGDGSCAHQGANVCSGVTATMRVGPYDLYPNGLRVD